MNTTEYYIKQLNQYRLLLIDKLRALGLECSDDEKFNSLIVKLYKLSSKEKIIVPNFSLLNCTLPKESVEYMLNNIEVTSIPTNLTDTFRHCVNLEEIKMSNIWKDCSQVAYLSSMFLGSGLKRLDISDCNFSNVTYGDISNTSNYLELDYINFTNSKLTINAFSGIYKYVGDPIIEGFETIDFNSTRISAAISGDIIVGKTNFNYDVSALLTDIARKGVRSSINLFNDLPTFDKPIIFPVSTFTSASSSRFLYKLPKVKHIDLSNVIINTTIFALGVKYIGEELTDEELEDAVFLLPDLNGKTINNTDLFLNNKIMKTFNANGVTFDLANISMFNGTNIEILDFTGATFPNQLTSSYDCKDMVKLKKFILNNAKLYFSNYSTKFFNNCPELEYLDLSNNTFYRYFKLEDNATGHVKLDKILFKNCIFDDFNIADGSYSVFTSKIIRNASVIDLEGSSIINKTIISLQSLFAECSKLKALDLTLVPSDSKITNFYLFLNNCSALEDLTFSFRPGYGMNSKTNNYSNYTLNLSGSPLLTHTSLMTVINNLYDLNISYGVYDENGNPGTGTLYTQKLVLGEENLAKLTPEEIAIATNKGWTVS